MTGGSGQRLINHSSSLKTVSSSSLHFSSSLFLSLSLSEFSGSQRTSRCSFSSCINKLRSQNCELFLSLVEELLRSAISCV
ncbi:hypothetical protein L2E82_20264 [Cichorium intybus]|uniref:Uncharacterized protein n=1 Tax=Cichorium intybus TaxID=13427 RepID=A0ACB9DSH6_CICIN|nr:hypothetical protein L2E82_20264 [Cichorium intybus]